jgi:hypothetical protein
MEKPTILDEKVLAEEEINYDIILDNFEQTICILCGRETQSFWEPRYKGVRASCVHCGINWAES